MCFRNPTVAETLVTDLLPDWINAYVNVFGEEAAMQTEIQIAEWHLLQEWATAVENFVANRVDRFNIMCALRRWLKWVVGEREGAQDDGHEPL